MRVARFRLGSKIRVACYWEEEEEKKRCRLWGERWSPGSTWIVGSAEERKRVESSRINLGKEEEGNGG